MASRPERVHHIGALANWHNSCMRLNANENHSHLDLGAQTGMILARQEVCQLNANDSHSHLDLGARTMGAWARRLARILHSMLQCVMCISHYEMTYHNAVCTNVVRCAYVSTHSHCTAPVSTHLHRLSAPVSTHLHCTNVVHR